MSLVVPTHAVSRARGRIALAWGLLGLFGCLLEAVVRLTPLALEPLRTGMDPLVWALYVGFVAFNAYAEGYRGFQCAFSPRLSVRAVLLMREPTLGRLVLAPLFLMALYDASRKRLLINWLLALGIVGLILLLRGTPQPFRGIVDAGVVVGLVWGMTATLVQLVRALRGAVPNVDPELSPLRGSVAQQTLDLA